MTLKLADAECVLQAAKQKAGEMGLKVVISILDAHGDLITMMRMDGAPWRSLAISSGKAFASVEYGVPSGELTDLAEKPSLKALMEIRGGLFVPQQGAVPIMKNDTLIGAIGVSGANSQDDEVVALAGVAAL